jgi:WD40 repeat protein
MPETRSTAPRVVRQINRRDILLSVARLPNSNRLLAGGSAGKVIEVDAGRDNPADRPLADHGRYVTSVRRVGRTVISGGYDGKLLWWDLEQARLVRSVAAHDRYIRHIEVSPDGTKVASVADDMVCRVWDAASGARLQELRGHEERTPTHFPSMLYACAFSADGRRLATGDRVGHVVIWETATGRRLGEVHAPGLYTWDGVQRIRSIGGVRALAFSPDGVQLAVGGIGHINNVDGLGAPSRVEIFDWAQGRNLAVFTGPNGIVNRLHYHPQGRWLCAAGGGNNGLLMFHDPARRTMLHSGNAPMHIHDVAFSEDFTMLYAVGHRKIALLEWRG